MDHGNDAVNLGEDDIVKSTQFSSGNCNASQQPAPSEFVYAASQPAAFGQPVYVPPGGIRPSQLNHSQENVAPSMSQVSFGAQSMWPNYGPPYRTPMHPMHHVVGSGVYSSFPPGNYNAFVPGYGGGHGGTAEAYLLPQSGHVGGVHQGCEWPTLHSNVAPLRERFPMPMEFECTLEPRSQTLRPRPSVSGHWQSCHPTMGNYDHQQGPSEREMNIGNEKTGSHANRSTVDGEKGVQVPSEVRHTPPTESEDTLQGPVLSASVERGKRVQSCEDPMQRSQSRTPSECNVVFEEDLQKSSKSIYPDSLNRRKALREDEKSYVKEVKAALSQGRVPQVEVLQDENGNLVRYRIQFMNAVKLAAHAVVQGAYIDVNEKDTMNEIMKEVRRQFVLRKPLPAGMVEEYLKAYFKRCRSKYHHFWLKHGDSKRPDGCKQAAWLQLVEYWKSPEGSKECKQNKLNASAEKLKSGGKPTADFEAFTESTDVGHVKGNASTVERSNQSDPLGFDKYMAVTPRTPVSTSLPTGAMARNPMADISNQLHDAVDNILSSFAVTCGALPSSIMKTGEGRGTLPAIGSQSQKTVRGAIRTAAEVLGSLQRPVTADNENEKIGAPVGNGEGHSVISGKNMFNENIEGEVVTVRRIPETFGPKGSAKDSSCKGKVLFRKGEVNDEENSPKTGSKNVWNGIVKEETVELSSDGSSEGLEFKVCRRPTAMRMDQTVKKSTQAYTEEIEEWPRHLAEKSNALGKQEKDVGKRNEEAVIAQQLPPPERKEVPNKNIIDGKKVREGLGRVESSKAHVPNCSKHSRQVDVEIDSIAGRQLEEDNEEARNVDEDFASLSEEEPAVLPRQIVKRKLVGNNGGSSATKEFTGAGLRKTRKVPVKKQKDCQIDSSILKKMEFFKRPKNANPIKNRVKVWVLHPKMVGKVVAEAFAGINRKSRCVDSANEICKEGQQMISVLRVLYKNTPVMFDSANRFPKDISYLDQAEGLPNTPILWCISHIIEIPPLDQITRYLGESIQGESPDARNSDSDFEDSRPKKGRPPTAVFVKESRKNRKMDVSSSVAQGQKNARTVLRSANA